MSFERIREICLSFPGTSEGIKYGDGLYFMVMEKVFCSSNMKNLDTANFKVPDENFEEMCEYPGVRPAPYGGTKFKWVQVTDLNLFTEKEWEHWLRQAYEQVKAKLPKKVIATLIAQ